MSKTSKLEYFTLFLVVVQAVVGIFFNVYRDPEWIKMAWFGNDLVTLVLVCPLYYFVLKAAEKNPIQKMLHLGVMGYLIYNYAYYLFGTVLNSVFPLYAVLFICAIANMIIWLSKSDIINFRKYFDISKSTKATAIIYLFIGIGLGMVWIGLWVSNVFFNKELPISEEAFKLVATLDLVIIVPNFVISGIYLISKRYIGYLIGVIIGIQGSFYLLILSVNSVISAIAAKNLPGETPIWGSLFVIETIGILLLLNNLKKEE